MEIRDCSAISLATRTDFPGPAVSYRKAVCSRQRPMLTDRLGSGLGTLCESAVLPRILPRQKTLRRRPASVWLSAIVSTKGLRCRTLFRGLDDGKKTNTIYRCIAEAIDEPRRKTPILPLTLILPIHPCDRSCTVDVATLRNLYNILQYNLSSNILYNLSIGLGDLG